ncbi:hypothetical protein [Vibrio coralliilyticus]|uniref:hypothetical protein n=1 Tax=Vibrio coralliilyticus TaxID=190893 RepID=UPI0017AAAF2F|nr:hypothetical protein [Vibrio coralliilyticus]NUW66930.1 hypothetical protein [Vibrio coralliilyticus]NUW70900.1 hypothetical protein [Vibrio coralliilyticus]
MKGWIKLHRSITEWEWYSDKNVCRFFIHLLLVANHSEKKWRGITVQKGQIVTSMKQLISDTGLTKSQIRTCIKKLISTQEIAHEGNTQYSVFTIKNYDNYQDNDTPDDTQIAHESHTSDPPMAHESHTDDIQMTTNKNVRIKECKNKKIHGASLASPDSAPVSQRKTHSVLEEHLTDESNDTSEPDGSENILARETLPLALEPDVTESPPSAPAAGAPEACSGQTKKSRQERMDFERVKAIYNATLTRARRVVTMNTTRKNLVRKLFRDHGMTLARWEKYLKHIESDPACQWMFEPRPRPDGDTWQVKGIDYIASERCYLSVVERLETESRAPPGDRRPDTLPHTL